MASGNARIGQLAPQFDAIAVVNNQFKRVKLSDFKGRFVMLFFYPADFTFVCPTEITAFSDRIKEFTDLGCDVVACSTDTHFSHQAWIEKPRKEGGLGEMQIPILADKTMTISRDYGVLKEDEGIAYRGLFIIDSRGILRQIIINDLPVGRSVDEALRLLQAIQFTDQYGEVCPVNWKPGKKSMKPDAKESKAYFQASQ